MPRANAADEPEISRLIGLRLKQLRLKKRLSMESVAEEIGVTHQQLQKYETGEQSLTATRLVALSRLFEVHVGYFFREPEGLEKYTAPDATLGHLMNRLLLIQRERPEALIVVQDIVRVLCNEIQGVRPTPRPHRRKKADQGINTARRRKRRESP
jgi:transcriptional regulator with XRE-family HTH domain